MPTKSFDTFDPTTNRIDAEVSTLKKQLESRASYNLDGDSLETNSKQSAASTIEVNIAVPTRYFSNNCFIGSLGRIY